MLDVFNKLKMAQSLHTGFLRHLRSFIPVELKNEVKELSAMALPVVSSMFKSCLYTFELLLSVYSYWAFMLYYIMS